MGHSWEGCPFCCVLKDLDTTNSNLLLVIKSKHSSGQNWFHLTIMFFDD